MKAPKSTQDEKERRSGPKQPIIIVPSALTSLITLYNAHLFLEKGVFKSTEEVRRTSPAKEAEIKLTHKFKSGKSITFRVLDSPNALSGSDWDNVVAVFASGHIWQFKGWKWEEPVDIFNHGTIRYSALAWRSFDCSQRVLCQILGCRRRSIHKEMECLAPGGMLRV